MRWVLGERVGGRKGGRGGREGEGFISARWQNKHTAAFDILQMVAGLVACTYIYADYTDRVESNCVEEKHSRGWTCSVAKHTLCCSASPEAHG